MSTGRCSWSTGQWLQVEAGLQVREQSQQQQAESRAMAHDLEQWRSSSEGGKWQQVRGRLPVLTIRHDLLTQLADHDVVVVSGDTGCGKTTQVQNKFAWIPAPTVVQAFLCKNCYLNIVVLIVLNQTLLSEYWTVA